MNGHTYSNMALKATISVQQSIDIGPAIYRWLYACLTEVLDDAHNVPLIYGVEEEEGTFKLMTDRLEIPARGNNQDSNNLFAVVPVYIVDLLSAIKSDCLLRQHRIEHCGIWSLNAVVQY